VSWLAIRDARVFGGIAAMRPTTAELASRSPRDGCTSCQTILAATNKFLAKSNKSQTGVKATKKRIRQKKRYPPPCACCGRRFHETMMLQEAKSIARHLGLTLRLVRSGAYRVNFRDGNETTAYHTDSLEDAVTTAVEMARTRDVMQAVDETVATGTVPRRIDDLPIDLNAVRREVEE
jgi:hypothetical protein